MTSAPWPLAPEVSFIQLAGVWRGYGTGDKAVQALTPLDLTIEQNELVVIIGPSGSGKTTLLNLLAGLERPSGGRLLFEGRDLGKLSRGEMLDYRRRIVGVVFQFYNLVSSLTARENLELVAHLAGTVQEVEPLMQKLNIAHLGDRFPAQLSGGEQQRVAIGRALVKRPRLLVADEPTGNLDHAAGDQIIELFHQAHSEGTCVLLVTHNPDYAKGATRVLRLQDGQLQ